MRNMQGLKILGLTILVMSSFSVGRFSAFLGDSPSPSQQGSGGTSSDAVQPDPTYYHSIPEMQEWCGAYPDGVWGMETDRLYKAKWSEQYGNMCAKEFMEK